MWQVLISQDVDKFLMKQDKNISERLLKGIQKLKVENPFIYLEHYEGNDYYKYRIGEYRCLIDVSFEEKVLFVRVLDHRSRVYK